MFQKPYILISCLLLTFFLGSCQKKLDSPTSLVNDKPDYSISAVGGASQEDTIGKVLANSVIVKINEPGSKLNKLFVRIFQQTLCNGDSVTERSVNNGDSISYKWRLSGQNGIQTLKFTVLNDQKKVIDSLKVTATALPPSHGWHASSCLIRDNMYLSSFAKLTTGRILFCYSGYDFPQYSDDNGISWHGLTSFYPLIDAEKAVVTPQNEIFVATEFNLVYYSADGGVTWEERGNGLPYRPHFVDLAYTPDNKLVYVSEGNGIYVSENKGLSWKIIKSGIIDSYTDYKYMDQQKNGDIYFTEENNFNLKLVKLDHASLQLSDVPDLPLKRIKSFCIDPKTGKMYAGGYDHDKSFAEVYESDDEGLSWVKVFSHPTTDLIDDGIYYMGLQSDGNYYFGTSYEAFYKTTDFRNIDIMETPPDKPIYSLHYIVANNGYFIYNSFPKSVVYYVP